MRIGHGYDLHRLEPLHPAGRGRPMVLGGVTFPDLSFGPVAHSDGDAVLHALTDALLGAIGEQDLGGRYPDTDPRWRDADSAQFVRDAVSLIRARGMEIGNVDITVICEQPKIGPHRAALRASIAEILGCAVELVNIKGKTHEGLDAIGEGRAIEAHAVCLLVERGTKN